MRRPDPAYPDDPVARDAGGVAMTGERRFWKAVGTAAADAALALAILLRLSGLHWDASVSAGPGREPVVVEHHLHPDERFLTMVTAALAWPDSWSAYLDTARSPLNPHNRNFGFFPYGTLPVFLTKAVGDGLGLGGYDRVHLVGRVLSTAADVATVVLTFALGLYLYGRAVGALAALLLAAAVLPIQQAHFFTVDTFAGALVALGLLSAARIAGEDRADLRDGILLGVAVGAGVACKATVGLLVIPAALAFATRWPRLREEPWRDRARWAAAVGAAALAAALVFRLAHPYAFEGPGFLDLRLNERWLANLREAGELMAGLRDIPPGHQWTDRAPLWFPWLNMVTVGMGPALGLAAWVGWLLAGWELFRRGSQHWRHLVPWTWVLVIFLHQGTQWVKSMRYLLPIYPALILFAAYLLVWFWRRAFPAAAHGRDATAALEDEPRPVMPAPRALAWRRAGAVAAVVLVLGGTFAWAWAFTSIYRRPHSRIEASRWIHDHVPKGAVLAIEHWDDPLPLRVDGRPESVYRGLQLPLYAEDTPDKLEAVLRMLDEADYVILASNRLYDSIPRLPMRYPVTSHYYRALFSGELGFRRAAEFTSYPTLFGMAVPDQWAEEAFSVYDHPRVQIFAKTGAWNRDRARALLTPADWEGIQKLSPRDAASFKGGLVMAAEAVSEQANSGTWSRRLDPVRGLWDRASLGNRLPVLAWGAALALLGLAAFPVVAVALGRFEDRGWLLSRPVGVLLVAVVAWLLGSTGLAPFGERAVWLGVGALALASSGAALARRSELIAFVRARWPRLLAGELLFWSAFAAFAWIRWQNPDLWHPSRGGEKPMDLAYLNAVLRSVSFPPYDPWFAGGYLNYYYFGFVLTAVLVKLTGIVPAVAYNLAVPTFFAFTAAGAFTAASELGAGLDRAVARRTGRSAGGRSAVSLACGLAGAVFVAVIGNLTQVRLLLEALGRAIPDHWWFWNASRAIPHPAAETGPITEFPFFTFLFGDLHAHAMALPYALVVLALVIHLVRQADEGPEAPRDGLAEGATLGLLGIATGALWPLNTWDFPTYIGLVAVGLVLREAGRRRALDTAAWTGAGWRLLVVVAVGRLAFHPFFTHFGTPYGTLEPWRGSQTPLAAFLLVHGFFLFTMASALLASLRSHAPGAPGRGLLVAGALGAGAAAVAGHGVEALLAALCALALAVLVEADRAAAERMLACLVVVGAVLCGAVEWLVLRGDVGRMNTVFKLYLQVWVVWAVAAAAGLGYLWALRAARPVARPLWLPWAAVWGGLFAGVLLYPILATPARLRDRFDQARERGLDGEAFMERAAIHDQGAAVPLAEDAAALRWLQDHVQGTPVIVEAAVPPYRWGSRVSVHTGLPTIVGWDWHQRQQRAVLRGDPVGRRLAHVRAIYTSPDVEAVLPLLTRYGARYVYVGPLERLYYPGPGLAKFERAPERFERVYDGPGVRIYRVVAP